jgi:hypothetical protein
VALTDTLSNPELILGADSIRNTDALHESYQDAEHVSVLHDHPDGFVLFDAHHVSVTDHQSDR